MPHRWIIVGSLVACGPSSAEMERARAEAARADALTSVSVKTDAFGDCSPEASDFGLLTQQWTELRTSMKAAVDIGATLPPKLVSAVASLSKTDDELTAIRANLDEGRALVPPTVSEPTYEKPEYSGAWYLSGNYRANYTGENGDIDGVVITKGSRYFVVLGAEPAGGYVSYLNGYVEDTGRVITLDVGRSGRDADVVTLTDRESYRDDQEAYAEQVSEAKATYRQQLAQYEQANREQKVAVEKLAATMAALGQEQERLVAAFGVDLLAGAKAVNEEFRAVSCASGQ